MRVLIAGASGLVGSAVAPYLASQGHEIVRLVRRAPAAGEVRWDPDAGSIDAQGLEGFDGVVHVAAIPQEKWTPDYMRRMRANRIGTNCLLAEALAGRARKPRVFVCASAQGVYPSSGDRVLTEQSSLGTDYLATLMLDAEAATEPARDAGIRVVSLRFPAVLGGPGLKPMTAQIRQMGNGRQWFSWVARDEVPAIVEHALLTEALKGPVNAVSPNPVTNAAFAATACRVTGRKPAMPMPAFAMRLLLGQIADGLLLASRRIEPARLLATGYRFRFPELEAALRHELTSP